MKKVFMSAAIVALMAAAVSCQCSNCKKAEEAAEETAACACGEACQCEEPCTCGEEESCTKACCDSTACAAAEGCTEACAEEAAE